MPDPLRPPAPANGGPPRAPQREAAEAVRRSEERFRTLIEKSSDVIALVDADYAILYITPSAQAVTGYPPEQLVGRVCLDFNHPDDRPAKQALLDECRRRPGHDFPLHFRYRHADGSWRVYEGVVRNRLDDPEVRALVINFRDVTARVQAEEGLRQSEARFRALVENAPIAIWEEDFAGVAAWFADLRAAGVVDLRAHLATRPEALDHALGLVRVRDVNPAAVAQAGATSREELFAGLGRIFTAESRVAFAEELAGLWEGRTAQAFESRVQRLDGTPVDVLINLNVARPDGQPDFSRVIVASTDITERRRSAAALAEQHRLQRAVLNSIPDLIGRKDATGRYQGCNRAFEAFVGRPEAEVRGRTDAELFSAELAAALVEADATVLAGGPAQRLEAWGEAADGRRVLVESLRVPLAGPDGRPMGLLGISRDITQRRQLEEQLGQAGKLEAVGQLAGGIAHDFNNILTAILGNLSLAADSLPAAHAARPLLAAGAQAAHRAADLTRQLLGFARRSPLAPEPTDLNDAVAEAVALLRRTIDPRVEIVVRAAAHPGPVLADRGQLTQVLMNLCLNARDAMPEGGTLTLETAAVTVDEAHARRQVTARAGPFVRLRVRDTGGGIAPELRERIFEPFFTTKGPGQGTGLGLAMVHGIVQQHHGWVECDSTPGRGSCFDVYLPRSAAPAGRPAPAAPPPEPARGTETVLLVDDEPMIRELGRVVLTRQGYRVLLAKDGREALEVYGREGSGIDLVVMDLTMPRLSGRDTCRELRARNPRVRVLLSSGYSEEFATSLAEECVCGFVSKPYRAADLAAAVRAALDKR